jgi:uncharacterized coiled-coil DUF342 family protein
MADLGELRASIEALAGKLQTLRQVIAEIKSATDISGSLDELKTRVDEIGTEIDEIIAEARGETGGTETPPEATQLPA